MNMLEQYYNDCVKSEDSPAFNQLSDEEKTRLKNSLGFAGWSSSKAAEQLRTAFFRHLYSNNTN